MKHLTALEVALRRRQYRKKWRKHTIRKKQPDYSAEAIQRDAKRFLDTVIERAERRLQQQHCARMKRLARYGLTPEAYRELHNQQGGVCAICQQAKPLHIDHSHDTGNVRGLLCSHCNTALGFMADSTARLHRAIDYLQAAQ